MFGLLLHSFRIADGAVAAVFQRTVAFNITYGRMAFVFNGPIILDVAHR